MQNERFKLGKDVLALAIITLIISVVWVALEVRGVFQQNTIPQLTQQQMKPLNPVLNKDIFDQLEQRISPDQNQIIQAVNANLSGVVSTKLVVATGSGIKSSESGTLNE
jgi:hypothetical protein